MSYNIQYDREALPSTLPEEPILLNQEPSGESRCTKFNQHLRETAIDCVNIAKGRRPRVYRCLMWAVIVLGLIVIIGLLAEWRAEKVEEGISTEVQGNTTEHTAFTELPFWNP